MEKLQMTAEGRRGCYLFVLFVALAAGSAASHARQLGETVRLDRESAPRVGIETAVVRTEPRQAGVRVVGTVVRSPDATTEVRSTVEGPVDGVFVEPGSRVERGQVLMVIHSHEVHEMAASLRLAEREREIAANRVEAGRRLLELEGISRLDLERREQELLRANLGVEAIRVELEDLGLTANEIQSLTVGDLHGELPVRAPVAGVVLDLHAAPGERVQPWVPLLSIGDPGRLELDLQVEPRLAELVQTGDRVRFGAVGSDPLFEAEVFTRVPEVERMTRTVRIRAHVDAPDGRLLPGMFVEGVLVPRADSDRGLRDDAMVTRVPEGAVVRIEGRDVVFVVSGESTYTVRALVLGPSDGRGYVVLDGLVAGEEIVVEGAFLLKSRAVRGDDSADDTEAEAPRR